MLALLLTAFVQIAAAQIPGLSKSNDSASAAPSDPLGRDTPLSAIVEFSRAADRGDFNSAARYLQLVGSQRTETVELCSALKILIDRELRQSIGQISDVPAGALHDGLPEDQEHIGPFIVDGAKTYIILVRIKDPQYGQIWLVSTDTLRQVRAMAHAAGKTWIERVMPDSLVDHEIFGLSLAHWIILIALLLTTFGLLVLIAAGSRMAAKAMVRDPARRRIWDDWYAGTHVPAIAAVTIIIQFLAIPPLGFPLTFRVIYARIGMVALVIALTWLLRRGLSLMFTHARGMLRGRDRASTHSLMRLSERMIQALIVVIAIIAVLILFGVESKTALAGLGVIGVALALGAQKTVENLLGGIFLLSDKALAVGDQCTIGSQSGTVEDVTLRSVRLRTSSQSLLSLPAGSLAQTGIENFATRRKILLDTRLRLKYGTSVEQLKRILEGVRALLADDPRLEKESAYIRLANFGPEAIEMELNAYVLSADAGVFRRVREELLLEIAALVESVGSGFAATPTGR